MRFANAAAIGLFVSNSGDVRSGSIEDAQLDEDL